MKMVRLFFILLVGSLSAEESKEAWNIKTLFGKIDKKCTEENKVDSPCCNPVKVVPLPPCKLPCQEECCPPKAVYNHNVTPPEKTLSCNSGLYITGDYLWWTVDTSFLQYAAEANNFFSISSSLYYNSVDYYITPDWTSGYRAGIGYNKISDAWDLNAYWTYYHNASNIRTTFVNNGSTGGYPLNNNPFYFNANSSPLGSPQVSGQYKVMYNMIDLELSRAFYVSCGLAVKPLFGVEGGWIKQTLRSTANAPAGSFNQTLAGGLSNYLLANQMNYWGIGPKFGLNTDWKLGGGLELFANFSAAFLYGQTYNNQLGTIYSLDSTNNTYINNKGNVRTLIPATKGIVGIGYATSFACDRCFFSLKAGWEVNYLLNFQSLKIFSSNNLSSLNLQGVTVDVEFDF